MPDFMGGILCAGLAAAPMSPHIPFYAVSDHIPAAYQKGEWLEKNRYEADSAYWLFENIGNLTNLFYQALHDLVEQTWGDFETRACEQQIIVETAGLSAFATSPQKAKNLLAAFSYHQALEAYDLGTELLAEIFTRLALLNTPQTALQFQNPEDWKLYGMVH